MKTPPHVPPQLAEILSAHSRAAVAFSGGVDSAYLLYALKVCGVDATAYYVKSAFQPQFELDHARKLQAELNFPMTVISLDILSQDSIRENPENRCYLCKKTIISEIVKQAAIHGISPIMDGSNFDDNPADRPGMRALDELSVLSPLRLAGLSKDAIRRLSRDANLFTWDKPAYACLATRVPSGYPLSHTILDKIEQAEITLFSLGFSDLRLRITNTGALLQLPAGQHENAAQKMEEISARLRPFFPSVTLDETPR